MNAAASDRKAMPRLVRYGPPLAASAERRFALRIAD